MPLRRLYVLVLVAFAVIVTAGVSGWALRVTSNELEKELDEKLRVTAAAAAAGFEASNLLLLGPGDEVNPFWQEADDRLRNLVDRGGYVDDAWLFRRRGSPSPPESAMRGPEEVPAAFGYSVIATTDSTYSGPLVIGAPVFIFNAYEPELEELWNNGLASTSLFESEDDGRGYKYGFARLEESDVALAVLMRADYLTPLAELRTLMLVGSGLVIALSVLVAVALAARIAKPLERLSRVALRIQRGRINRAVALEPGVEIGRLSRAMERMRQGIIQHDEYLRLMLAQVAHEIRNPLGGLKLFAAIAAESTDPDERAQLFQRIQAEVDALNHIITDFLLYARPRAPEKKLHDIRAPLREAAELVAAQLDSAGGGLEVELPDTDLEAVADPGQVKRMILNLLRNAADAGDRVWLKGEWRNGEVMISVRDNGPGVPESLRERIFEPFFSSKEKGAGLGLAIVGGVARANDARVELVSGGRPAGNGAEFRLYLPSSEEFPVARDGARAR